MQQAQTASWFWKCALAAALVLLACRLATAWLGADLQQPSTTTRDGSLVTLNRYVREGTPDVVLVGSSVTWRLKEEYFSIANVRNLALAGGSPITGLMIVARQPRLPKLILIETNVLSRGVDAGLVEKFSAQGRVDLVFLRPVRTAVAWYENWMHAPPGREQASAVRSRLLARPPSEFDNHVYVDRAVRQMNEEDPANAVRENIDQLKRLVALVESRGSKALLLEVPFSSRIENSRSARLTKTMVHAAFTPDQWLKITPPTGELRWADGVHLDERSALIVVQSIEAALAARFGSI